jgi:serine protease AprX
MKYDTLPTRLAALVSMFCLPSALTSGTAASATSTVMLQGNSALELRRLVESHGGTVSHDLPIIDAVGAVVPRSRLAEILSSPLVKRHIDDLSLSDAPELPAREEPAVGCHVGGALELDISRTGFDWTLYNKDVTTASLTRLELGWPAGLGAIAQISLAGQVLPPALYREARSGALSLALDATSAPGLSGSGNLVVRFKPGLPAGSALPEQRQFTVKASFAGDCRAELVPAYENNHGDFYYATVVGASALHLLGVTGEGVTVAVLDSGLWEHEALARDTSGRYRVVARYDAITDTLGGPVFDESGHGTHMTSVLAHSGAVTENGKSTGGYKGIAPDVDLVAVKAFDLEGQGDFLDIVRAIQWVVDHRETYNIRVLNLSFAARPRWHYWLDPINQSIMRAWASGIAVVAAAGNEGPEPMTIGSPGNLPYIITVGAVTDSWTADSRNDDYIPDFSSRGPTPDAHVKPDIVAPGGHITGITRPGSTLTRQYPEYLLRTGEFVMTGSSQATALVSGVVALLLQLEPNLSPDEVKCKLITSADPAINRDGLLAYSPFEQGHGYVSATRAVTLGRRDCGEPKMDIRFEIDNLEHFQGPAIVLENGSVSLPGLAETLSPSASPKGLSDSRRWGVKEHIERLSASSPLADSQPSPPFDWHGIYLEEKSRIEQLAREASP